MLITILSICADIDREATKDVPSIDPIVLGSSKFLWLRLTVRMEVVSSPRREDPARRGGAAGISRSLPTLWTKPSSGF
jgi:hypothetical protein